MSPPHKAKTGLCGAPVWIRWSGTLAHLQRPEGLKAYRLQFELRQRCPGRHIFCNHMGLRASNDLMQIAESPTLESRCLSFSRIPHTSRLFDDYLHHFDKVRQFYARPPLQHEWWQEEIKKIQYPAERRKQVAAILERQNREFGAGEKTLANIERLREGAPAMVTGQQVGLFGGPLFCVLKALTAVKLAEEADAVPVFWMATEDHDYEEINAVNFPAGDHLQKFS